ncbi:MAG: glycosyltransferase, partial [Erythrobacter sp.]|nr:glycosyltransferase [Erythrobacter sp.]
MADPPHILLFLKSFATGGVERTALRMVHEWRAMGLPVTLWLAQDSGTMRGEFRGGLMPVVAHKDGMLARISHLSRTIRDVRPDVIYCAGNTYAIYAAAVRVRLGRQCPPIAIKISNDLERHDMNAGVRWGYHRWMGLQGRLFDHFVAMSDALRPEIERYAG